MHGFRAVETAAYCPRKLYYRRQSPEEITIPDEVEQRRELAFNYETLLADEETLATAALEVTPTQFRSRLGCAKAKFPEWEHLINPADRDTYLRGRDCHGIVHKLLDTDEPSLSLVFAGEPPETGVWKPQSVRLIAAAKALSWELNQEVSFVFAEYPAHGVIRRVPVDSRRTADYRDAVRTADSIDGPPARVTNRSKCQNCEFAGQCGVKTRSVRSLLGD